MKTLSKKFTYFAATALTSVLMMDQASARPDFFNAFRKSKPSPEAEQNNANVDVLGKLTNKIKDLAKSKNDVSHYLIVFGYEDASKTAAQSHTFAAYVEASSNKNVEPLWSSISWLPTEYETRRNICIFKNLFGAIKNQLLGDSCDSEPGKNFSVEQTLQMAKGTGKNLAAWGPYRITPAMYAAGIARVVDLNKGRVKYLANDTNTRPTGEAINCMHAVSDLFDQGPSTGGFLNFGYSVWGVKGTKHVLNFFAGFGPEYIIDPIRIDKFDPYKNY